MSSRLVLPSENWLFAKRDIVNREHYFNKNKIPREKLGMTEKKPYLVQDPIAIGLQLSLA